MARNCPLCNPKCMGLMSPIAMAMAVQECGSHDMATIRVYHEGSREQLAAYVEGLADRPHPILRLIEDD